MRTTRRTISLLAATLFALGMLAGPATAMQPPADAAADRFGCVVGEDGEFSHPVLGHPGAAGIVDAHARVSELTENPQATAWMAVKHADPIEGGGCGDEDNDK